MPNIGRPSRDCHACRQRRVKCDLARPECQQCRRRGVSCRGYRDELDILFRVESTSSYPSNAGRDRRRTHHREQTPPTVARPRTSRPGIEGSPQETVARWLPTNHAELVLAGLTPDADFALTREEIMEQVDASLQAAEQASPTRQSLLGSCNDHLIPLIMYRFSFGTVNGQVQSLFDFLRPLMTRAEEGSPLFLACHAVGSAYLANKAGQSNPVSDPVKAYIPALSAINRALHDPEDYKTDSTLLGVWLLGFYELMLGTRNERSPRTMSKAWDIHSQGLAELVQLRGPEQFARKEGRDLFWVVFNTIQIRALMTGQEFPKGTVAWLHEINRNCGPSEHILLRAVLYNYHCTTLCSRIRRIVNTGSVDDILSSSPSILRDMEEVEKTTWPLSHEKKITDCRIYAPLEAIPDHAMDTPHAWINNYQNNFRMRLSYYVLEFLVHACKAPNCTSQQRDIFNRYRWRCIQEFRSIVDKMLFIPSQEP